MLASPTRCTENLVVFRDELEFQGVQTQEYRFNHWSGGCHLKEGPGAVNTFVVDLVVGCRCVLARRPVARLAGGCSEGGFGG